MGRVVRLLSRSACFLLAWATFSSLGVDETLAGRPVWKPTALPGRFCHSLALNARYSPAIALDPVRRRIVMFGGMTLSQPPSYLDDVWALDLEGVPAWRRLVPDGNGPGGRDEACLVYDSDGDRMVLFGGRT